MCAFMYVKRKRDKEKANAKKFQQLGSTGKESMHHCTTLSTFLRVPSFIKSWGILQGIFLPSEHGLQICLLDFEFLQLFNVLIPLDGYRTKISPARKEKQAIYVITKAKQLFPLSRKKKLPSLYLLASYILINCYFPNAI